ncbi:MAG TPA: hypothetical protein VFV47_01150 [Hyphomicrobiaceae bacterium]|nr:hypothetical protein [Hyphomicrobiaceae bacterium]
MQVSPNHIEDVRELQARVGRAMATPKRPRSKIPFVFGAFLSWVLIWALVAAYCFLMPETYGSRWTLIMPGSGSSVSVSLESIGQSSSHPANQFASSSHSPKVIYKEIAQSDQVRAAAAHALDMTPAEFGRPRIRLIEETSLLLLEMRGPTPEIAQKKAMALHQALEEQLDALRRDELAKRAAVVRANLQGYQDQVTAARARIIEAQRRSGLASVAQYNEISSSVVLARRRLVELRSEIERLSNEQALLVERVGVDPATAAVALRLSSDPAFVRLANEFADANAAHQAETGRLGPSNPFLVNARKRRSAVLEQLASLPGAVVSDATQDLERVALLISHSQRGDLLKTVVSNESALEGRRNEARALEEQIAALQNEVKTMGEASAQLEDLRKDQLVAEAVLTSAIARLDTSKSDVYGSYPLLQVLAAPDLPDFPSQPIVPLAVLGGLVGSLLAAFAWTLAWWQNASSRARRKRA